MKGYQAIGALACLSLSSCVPWTVRPIDEMQSGAFDAERYVESIWRSKVLPAAAQGADLRSARLDGARLVKGEGRVLRVDTSSRSGLLFLDLPPYNGRADAAVQIGPVIRGTALRDAMPFIQFSQFTNQLEFARVGNALNERAAKLPGEAVRGSVVAFTGAATGGEPPEIVPVTLMVKDKE